jgi:hypothetical protein
LHDQSGFLPVSLGREDTGGKGTRLFYRADRIIRDTFTLLNRHLSIVSRDTDFFPDS